MLTIGELLKKETFQIEEIDTIIKCLKEFHLSDELCSIVKYRLDKKQERPVITSRQEQRQEPKPQISAKENKAIWHELMQYFDFDKMQSIKYLTQEEISRCLELLTLVNIPLDRQKVFLEIVLNSNPKFKIDPIEEYNDLLNKIQNYSENIELNDLNTLKECLEEMRTSNSEEKVFYRQMFIETFKNIIDNIPKDGSYELSLRANKPMI